MKITTRELKGAALDWAVARCLGRRPSLFIFERTGSLAREHAYSTDWSIGGPIIEREGLNVRPCYSGGIRNTGVDSWRADLDFQSGTLTLGKFTMYGKTTLVAAMRCFVASKLGDTVDIPDELV